jgi:hypothetical protein
MIGPHSQSYKPYPVASALPGRKRMIEALEAAGYKIKVRI